MERLTERIGGEVFPYARDCYNENPKMCGKGWCEKTVSTQNDCDVCPINRCLRKLADYEDAEAEGRLLILPVARGNILYRIAGDEILEECVRDIVFRGTGDWSLYSNFNKTVFLTRAEAVTAQKSSTD